MKKDKILELISGHQKELATKKQTYESRRMHTRRIEELIVEYNK